MTGCCRVCGEPLQGTGLARGACLGCFRVEQQVLEFGNELAIDLRAREREAHRRGFGDAVGRVVRMRDFLAGRRPGVKP